MIDFNLSALAVRERAVTLFLIIAIGIAGTLAFFQLGRAEDPSFTIKVLTVTASWPGATAREMQDLVAEPLEKRLQELRFYDHVDTFTRPGLAFLTLSLKDTTPPADVADEFYQARKKMGDEASHLPTGALGPFVNDEYSDNAFALYALRAPGIPPRDLAREAEAIRQNLLHVAGVRKVNIVGERTERIFVEISHARLATLGVTAPAIFDALARQNAVTPAGSIETAGPTVFVRLDGALDGIEAVRAVPVTAGGRLLRLGDIAELRRGYEDPPSFLVRQDGQPALILSVIMQDRWNGLSLGHALRVEEAALAGQLPVGISFDRISDQARNISEAVDEFMLKFAVALAVVIAVSLVALGFRVGIVVAAAVPLTLGAVFVIMLATGRVFDRITLGALILSLGLLVDDAIIAIEMMVVKMQEGLDRTQAATFAWTVTAAPMLTGTLLTIVGFLPVGFAQSSAGEYAGNIFWIVAFALLTSWIVAVSFTPYLGVKLLPAIRPVPGGHDAIYATRSYARLRRLVTACVDHKGRVALATATAFLLSAGGLVVMEKQFFPNSDRPELLVEIYEPEGSTIATTLAAVERIERVVRGQPETQLVTSYVGQGAPRFFLSLNPELPDPAFARLVILTPDPAARDRLKLTLRRAIAGGLVPGARVRVAQLLFGPPVPYPVAFRVIGPDPGVLRGIAARVAEIMRADLDMRDVNFDWFERAPALRVAFDQDRLRLLGLTPKDASDQLQAYLSGAPVTQMREDIRAVELDVRATPAEQRGLGAIGDLTLTTRDGRSIPLAGVGRLETAFEDPVLRRRDREPTITVRGDIAEGVQPTGVTARVAGHLDAITAALPPGYRIETGGSVEEGGKANRALVAVFPIMILLMLLIIMLQVRSFAGMAMVFMTAPLGLVGTVPTLLLFHQPFGFTAILGLIGLAGILMRNTLILTEQIKADREAGQDDHHAIIEATVRRARPVILTSLAAVLAFIPLTFSSFWGPLAYTLIGGVAVGTVLTLLFLPALYALWFGVSGPVVGSTELNFQMAVSGAGDGRSTP